MPYITFKSKHINRLGRSAASAFQEESRGHNSCCVCRTHTGAAWQNPPVCDSIQKSAERIIHSRAHSKVSADARWYIYTNADASRLADKIFIFPSKIYQLRVGKNIATNNKTRLWFPHTEASNNILSQNIKGGRGAFLTSTILNQKVISKINFF